MVLFWFCILLVLGLAFGILLVDTIVDYIRNKANKAIDIILKATIQKSKEKAKQALEEKRKMQLQAKNSKRNQQ